MFDELNLPDSNKDIVGYDLPKSVTIASSSVEYNSIAYSTAQPIDQSELKRLGEKNLRIVSKKDI